MKTLKKIALTLVLVILITISLDFAIKKLTPKKIVDVPSPSIAEPSMVETNISDIKIDVELPNVPNEMEIYSASSNETANYLTAHLSQKFQLTQNPEIENVWMDSNYNWMLSFSPISDQITLSNLKAEANAAPIDQEEALSYAESFIESLGLNFQVEADKENVENIIGYGSDKNYVQRIPYIQKINNYDLYFSNELETTIIVFVVKNYGVSKIVINNPSLIIDASGFAKTLPKDEVLSAIESKKGIILGIDDTSSLLNTYKNIKNLVINEVNIEYREDPSSGLVIPFYRFEGSALSIQNDDLDIDIVYPVIETQK